VATTSVTDDQTVTATGSQVQPKQLAPVAAGTAAITVWLAALGLITTPYMLHRLGTSAYAIFALVTIVSGYLSNLELGFGHATLRYLARARAAGDTVEEARIIQTSLSVFMLAALVAGVIAYALAPTIATKFASFPANLQDEAVGAIRLGALIVILAFLFSFVSVALQAFGRFRVMLTTKVIMGTCLSVAAVAMAALFKDVRAVLLAQAVITIVACSFLFFALARATTARLRPAFHGSIFKKLLAYSGLVFVIGIAYQVMLQGPPTVLAGVAVAAQLTAYAVPAVILQQMSFLTTSFSAGFVPFASAESARDDRGRLAAVFRSNMRITILVMTPVAGFLAVYAEPLLRAWIGGGFAHQAAGPLKVLAAAGLLIALGSPAGDVARGLNHLGWLLAYVAAAAVLAVGGALALAPDHGAEGAALALLFALVITTVPFALAAPSRMLGESPRKLLPALRSPTLAALIVCALYLLGSHLISGFAGAVVIGIIVTPLYALAVYRFVFDDRERATLRAGINRRRPGG
jgi:O-antigen/teichoic acid export membrane protein